MPVTLVLGTDPARLLAEAAGGFLTPRAATTDSPFPSPDYLLALRQRGIRDDLLTLAAERNVPGWFDPPLCTFRELPNWLGATERQPCGDFERAALLSDVVRRVAGPVFGRVAQLDHYLGALEHLVGELMSEGVAADDLAAVVARVEHQAAFERERDEELVAVYQLYCEELERSGLRDGRDELVDCARAIQEDAEGLARRLGGRREIRAYGLLDLRGGWRVLLAALAQSSAIDRVLLYGTDALAFGSNLDIEVVVLDEGSSVATRLFGNGERGTEHVDVIEAPSVEREVGEVARRVRDLADRGVPLPRIAVVAREARPYVDLALRALGKFGVPGTARRRFSYAEIPVVKAILTLFTAAAEGWTRRTLVDLADQPYFSHQLDSRVLNVVGYRRVTRGLDEWERGLAALAREVEEWERGDAPTGPPPVTSRQTEAAQAALSTFVRSASALEGERTLGSWLEWLRAFLTTDPWDIEAQIYQVPETRFDIARRDLAGWRGLLRILDEWAQAIDRWGGADETLGVRAFSARLREMLAGDVALWTETRRGVRVLEGLAAAYRSFDYVFFVGMEAGGFPVHPPRSAILDDVDRAELIAAGLPLDRRSDWEERERSLFRALVGGVQTHLTVSFARLNALGQETVRSAFIDALDEVAVAVPALVDRHEILTPEMPLYSSPAAGAHARRAAEIDAERSSAVPSPYDGRIMDEDAVQWLSETFGDERIWSPTQLEEYAKCPWAFFSKHVLRVAKREDPADEMEATVRGNIFHATLATFYERASARGGGPVLLLPDDLEWAEPLLVNAMDDTIAAFSDAVWLGHPLLWTAKRQELQRVLLRFVRWEAQQNAAMFDRAKKNAPARLRTAVSDHERRFDGVVLERRDVRVTFRGIIDRVEVGVDERIQQSDRFLAAVDYKTSAAGTPGGGDAQAWDDNVVLQVPMYAYALGELETGKRVCRAEYRSLQPPGHVHALQLQQVDPKTHIRHGDPGDEARFERALDAVATHVLRTRLGEFPASPAPSCLCPPFCHAWDICRVRGGPRVKPKARR